MLKINGKEVKIPELDFGFVSFLEENGTPIFDQGVRKKVLSLARNFVAYAWHTDPDDASYQLNQHVLAGGTLDKLYEAVYEAIGNSDFLKKLAENKTKEEKAKAAASQPAAKPE